MNKFDARIVRLARYRSMLDNVKQERKALMDAFIQSAEYESAVEEVDEFEKIVASIEAEIKQEAEADGDKHPHPAIEVKTFTVYDYPEPEAIAYCQLHAPVALKISLDKAMFKSIAQKASLPFVTVKSTPKAQIASDLSKYITEEK